MLSQARGRQQEKGWEQLRLGETTNSDSSPPPDQFWAAAGVGAAWRWHGPAGEGFDGAVVKQMQRFLSSDHPRVRILGGTR